MKESMTYRILSITEKLMAESGIHTLSMQKIAKEANISVGTIYIHFKNKNELLQELAKYLFARVNQALGEHYDETEDVKSQYRQMWWDFWYFFQQNENVMKNIYQYQNIPGFSEILKNCKNQREEAWEKFIHLGKKAKKICDLPSDVLFSLSLESVMKLCCWQQLYQTSFSSDVIEQVIERTWNCISL